MPKTSLFITLVSIILFFSQGCDEDDGDSIEINLVEKTIKADLGGLLITSDSIEIDIPADALPIDGKVTIGRTGKEFTTFPNTNLELVNPPFSLIIPSDTLLKPLQLSLPLPAGLADPAGFYFFIYNGTSYFPVDFSVDGSHLNVNIDIINWDKNETKTTITGSVVTLVVYWLKYKQTPPEDEMGLQKVSLQNDVMVYTEPTANAESKVLLMVHGWMGRTTKWESFLAWMEEETELSYSEYWTFGYNSSQSINQNAELLANAIREDASGAQIDMVGHSMGGLVSRSMIESYGGDSYIHKLITLGSPHKGSPLAAIRKYLGYLVISDKPEDYPDYAYNTKGFRDLYTNSSYITQMQTLTNPPIPYYTIAAINNSDWNFYIPGPDDGIVGVESALGVPNATSQESILNLPYKEAHREIPEYNPIYEQVVEYLQIIEE